jgi:hypothetical protein
MYKAIVKHVFGNFIEIFYILLDMKPCPLVLRVQKCPYFPLSNIFSISIVFHIYLYRKIFFSFRFSYCAFSESLTWFRIRSLLANDKIISPISIIFLIASARYRFSRALLDQSKSLAAFSSSSNIEISESTYKIRIVNLLKLTIERNPSRISENVLIWRLYLRALFDDNFDTSLGKCKNVLYSALEVGSIPILSFFMMG